MPTRVLIADDESHCRAELRELLREFSDYEVAGEAINGIDALEKCRQLAPEIVLLDIQMPGLTGLEVAAAIDQTPMPQIIFVTAYDQHAIRAFELGALDYLLKPASAERLGQSLARAARQRAMPDNPMPAQLEAIMQAWLQAKPEYLARVVARKGQRIIVLPVEEIYCFEMEDQLLFAVTERERYWTNYQLKTLEPRLDAKLFLRTHRESIVNVNYIRELSPITRERYEMTLRNNHKLTVSRNYLPQIKAMLGWD